jgi:hypothetical protein
VVFDHDPRRSEAASLPFPEASEREIRDIDLGEAQAKPVSIALGFGIFGLGSTHIAEGLATAIAVPLGPREQVSIPVPDLLRNLSESLAGLSQLLLRGVLWMILLRHRVLLRFLIML